MATNESAAVIRSSQEIDIWGVVDGGTAGGCSSGNDEWCLIVHLAGWKYPDGKLCKEKVRVEMPVPKADLRLYMDRIRPYSLIRMRGTMTPKQKWCSYCQASSVELSDLDEECALFAVELQKPIVFVDDHFGELTLQRDGYDSYLGTIKWDGKNVPLSINLEMGNDLHFLIENAKQLHAAEKTWVERLSAYAETEVLPLMNQQWREDETPFSFAEFKSLMQMDSIGINAPDLIGFHFDGPEIWQVFSITASLSEGICNVEIAH